MILLDIPSLLAPISGDYPCGQDLREVTSADYQTLKDTRRTIAGLLRSRKFDADADNEINSHWQTIFKLAPKVIKEQSKDLEVAAWITEAALKLHGYAGLRDALELSKGLIEQYWEQLYPLPDEDGIETRVYPLAGLNGEDGSGTLILPLKNVALSEDGDHPFTFNLYVRCLDAEQIADPEARQLRQNDIGVSLQDIHSQVNASSTPFYQALIADLEQCLAQFNAMTTLLDDKCGLASSPPSSAIKKTLQDVLDALKTLTKNKLAPLANTVEQTSAATAQGHTQPNVTTPAVQRTLTVGPLGSREEALNQLLQVADYFRQTEPHSPLCGALERVVAWGRMSLQELMMELIPDANARANYTLRTGIDLGEGAAPVGQLAQSAYTRSAKIAVNPVAAEPVRQDLGVREDGQQKPESNSFGHEANLSGW